MPCFDLEIQEFLEEHAFFKIFVAHCFHEIFRVAIFSIQILFKGSFQSCNKSLINQACSGPYLENTGPRSFLYGRPWADILPVRLSRLVNKIYVLKPKNPNKHPPRSHWRSKEGGTYYTGTVHVYMYSVLSKL